MEIEVITSLRICYYYALRAIRERILRGRKNIRKSKKKYTYLLKVNKKKVKINHPSHCCLA